MNAKPILAYDCATLGASVALRVGNHTYTRAIGQTRQAAELVSTIDALLRERAVTYQDLGCIITTIGPGSFTGIRIGLAALHGFALVHPTPIKLVTTLEAMAWNIESDQPHYILLRAGKGEVYAQQFQNKKPIGDIFLAPETKTDWDAPHYLLDGPDAAALCNAADHLADACLADALPLYIRPPDAKMPAPHAWLAAN